MPFKIIRADITTLKVDAIVNAANSTLLGGGGVDGAIHRVAGPELLAECRALGGCEVGQAKVTRAYQLPAKCVIHTVGPVWRGGNEGEEGLLTACYQNSLSLAHQKGLKSIAFPLISTGVYQFPKELALQIATTVITEFLLRQDMTVYLVVYDRASFHVSTKLFADIQQFINDQYSDEHIERRSRSSESSEIRAAEQDEAPTYAKSFEMTKFAMNQVEARSLDDVLNQLEETFSRRLLRMID